MLNIVLWGHAGIGRLGQSGICCDISTKGRLHIEHGLKILDRFPGAHCHPTPSQHISTTWPALQRQE